jgi:alpha 1,2-mannosyltransferase
VTVDDGLDLDSLPGLGADGLPMPLRPGPGGRRANATLLMLARNSDVDTAIRSVRRLEDRFNRHFHYHWLFLNDNDFDQNFKDRISILVSGEVTFATIPREHWVQPDWIDEEKAKASRDKMSEEGVIYGGSKPYRNMCRFNSGVSANFLARMMTCLTRVGQFFFKHPEILKYRWYWRVEYVVATLFLALHAHTV